jgi:hypothetical protein
VSEVLSVSTASNLKWTTTSLEFISGPPVNDELSASAGEMHPQCHLRKHLYGAICEVAHEERLIREKQDKREAYKFQECAHLTLL